MKRILITLIALVLGGVAWSQNAKMPQNITIKTLDGESVQSSVIQNDGKPVIISFWATWCKPCNRELKAIQEVYEEWQEETGVRVIAISIDQAQNIQKVKPLVDGYGWEYEILLDPNSEFLRAVGGQMIPYTLIVDAKGKVVYKHSGYTDGAETELIEKVRELLK